VLGLTLQDLDFFFLDDPKEFVESQLSGPESKTVFVNKKSYHEIKNVLTVETRNNFRIL